MSDRRGTPSRVLGGAAGARVARRVIGALVLLTSPAAVLVAVAGGAPGTVSVMGRTGEPRIGQAAGPRETGSVRAVDATRTRAHSDWVLYCQGCHEAGAKGSALGRIPPLADSIGYFLQVPGGREYLVQVPGVNNTGLDDARLADVVNYVVDAFAGASRPARFERYTEQQVRAYRAARPTDIAWRRRELLEARQQAGLPPP